MYRSAPITFGSPPVVISEIDELLAALDAAKIKKPHRKLITKALMAAAGL